jgi:hypothetical protein
MGKDRSWTDRQLQDAVAASTTYRGVLRALGLKFGSLGYVQRCIQNLGVSTAHFDNNPRARKQLCSDEDLRAAVAASKTVTEVLTKIGVEPHSNSYNKLHRHIGQLRIDASHLSDLRNRAKARCWTDDDLRRAVADSRSLSQAIRKLGMVPAGANFDHIRRRVRELSIDTGHFLGKGWNVGLQFRPNAPLPLDQVLVAGRWTSTYNLKQRLFKAGLKKAECELCGWAVRAPDGRVPVELDHINGDKNDNRLDNLRVLCPNCHSLQPTHRGLNKKTRREKN